MILQSVLDDHQPLESALAHPSYTVLAENDRALTRAIASTTLRRLGQIDKILTNVMDRPLGKRGGPAMHILRLAIAQILFMEVPDHAAVSVAMDVAKSDHKARHFSRLINGVLRGITREKEKHLAALKPEDILAQWISKSWASHYGANTRNQMAEALLHEPYLDISSSDTETPAAKQLNGQLLFNGTTRLKLKGAVTSLPGFNEGTWWVQDIAASLPPALIKTPQDKEIADLCAAPGGKTAFLAARGAKVTSVDISSDRLERLKENLNRLKLTAEIVRTDLLSWQPDKLFDAVLLDAPCSATGTARKHPDVLWLKKPELVTELAELQKKLLVQAVKLLKPGGTLVFCTCSLQPEEGEQILDFVTTSNLPLTLDPIQKDELSHLDTIITDRGTVRTLPHLQPHIVRDYGEQSDIVDPTLSGMDGFFAARFIRKNYETG